MLRKKVKLGSQEETESKKGKLNEREGKKRSHQANQVTHGKIVSHNGN